MHESLSNGQPIYFLTICGPSSVGGELLAVLNEVVDSPFEVGPIFTYGAPPSGVESNELSGGRAISTQAQILVRGVQLERLMALLREKLRNSGVRYWLTPIVTQGQIE